MTNLTFAAGAEWLAIISPHFYIYICSYDCDQNNELISLKLNLFILFKRSKSITGPMDEKGLLNL